MSEAPARVKAIGQPRYILPLLSTALALSYLDRFVLNLLVEPIKREFALTDLEISLLQGFAFAVFFVIAGLPIGRLIDHSRRMTIMAFGIATWSLMTIACGFANGFLYLMVCRVGVAVGEATILPAGLSVISDIVSRRRLGLAIGLFTMGAYVGAGLAYVGGGLLVARLGVANGVDLPMLGHLDPWRATFVIAGVPGLLIASVLAVVREPRRTGASTTAHVPLGDLVAFARLNARSLAAILLCVTSVSVSGQAFAAWTPSLLMRTFGWTIAQAGGASGLVVIVSAIPGVLFGGMIGDAMTRRGVNNGRRMVMFLSAICALPLGVAAPVAKDPRLLLLLLTLTTFLTTIVVTNGIAAWQDGMPSRFQGTMIAAWALVTNLGGLGIGPTAVAFVTNILFHDETRLGAALSGVCAVSLGLAVLAGGIALFAPRIRVPASTV